MYAARPSLTASQGLRHSAAAPQKRETFLAVHVFGSTQQRRSGVPPAQVATPPSASAEQ